MKQNKKSKYLLKTMQGILMILPQSKTFNVIKVRLDCVNITNFSLPFIGEEEETEQDELETKNQVIECLSQFKLQRERYNKYLEDQLFMSN